MGPAALLGPGARIRDFGRRGVRLLPVFAKLVQAALDDSPAPHVVQPGDGSALYPAGHCLHSTDAVFGADIAVLLVDADDSGVHINRRLLFLCCAVFDSDGHVLRARSAV